MRDAWPELRAVKGYEGLYAVSELGRVFSYPKPSNNRYLHGRWMRPSVGSRNHKGGGTGYHVVQLYKDGNFESVLVHRLVATHFIPNPMGWPQVNHKDGNKANNAVDNLEWCTAKMNVRHAVALHQKRKEKAA